MIEIEPRVAAGALTRSAERPLVLYVEDNPMNARLMERVFSMRTDLDLRCVDTAERGLAVARTTPVALILLDINLPVMSGYEALRALRADPGTASIPVVALTSDAMRGDAARGLRAGFDAYVTKPIDVVHLLQLVDRYVSAGAGDD